MPVSHRDIARRAFATNEWRSAVDALFQATGINVQAADLREQVGLSSATRCTYCHLAADVTEPGPLSCFDECPRPDAGPQRIVCRAGLPVLIAPVVIEDRAVAHILASGFVTSTRERRGLYERLLSRGAPEASARRAVKSLPVVSRREADSYLQLAVASAQTVLSSVGERLAAAERVEELRLFVSAGRQVVGTDRLDADTLGPVAEEAVALAGGQAGAILRPRAGMLEVVARTEGWRGPIGAMVPREGTAAGRAVETARTVVSPGRSGAGTLALPLALGDKVLGVLEVRIDSDRLPLPADRVSRLTRFGQFIAIALQRDDERTQVDRAMAGYAQLNELAAKLGGQTDIDGVARLVTEVLDRSFTFDVAGLVLTSWGRDRADVVISGSLSRSEFEHVLGVASGRDVAERPFTTVNEQTLRGEVADGDDLRPDWAISVVELPYGDLDVGWLFVARADGERYGKQDRALLEGIAAHAAAAFGRSALFGRIRDDYAKTIAALSATLDMGERTSSGHAGRVMEHAMAIGEELGLTFEDVEQLRFAGLLHDIGKTGVPEEILLKPSKLTPEELARVRAHAEIGASIVEQIEFLKSITPIILHHHERFDGNGYPHRLKGDQIPLLARVLCVADAYDAMTTERTYANRLTAAQARDELENGAGTQFDPRVVAAFLEVLDKQARAGATGLLAPREAHGRPEMPA